MHSGEDGGGGTAEGFAADDAALGIADHAAGVKDIGAGGNAGGDKSTDNVNRIGHGVWQVFDIAIVRVGDGDGCTGSGGEFAVGDGFNIDAGNHAKGLDGGGANVDFVRGEVENLGRHGAVLPFISCCFLAGDSIGINGQGVFIRLAKDGEGDGCRAGRVIINLDVGHDQAAGGGEGQEDKAEGEEEGGENAARFHLVDFLSLAKPIQFMMQ